MSNGITATDIRDGIKDEYRAFFRVSCATPLDRAAVMPIVEAFWCSTELICPRARTLPTVCVIFAPAPFTISLENGVLTFAPRPEVVNVVVDNIIFLDTDKMITIPQPELVSYILEELVHTIFNIKDERLAKAVTADLRTRSP